MLLCPFDGEEAARRRAGIGHITGVELEKGKFVLERVAGVFSLIRRTRKVPMDWHHSEAWLAPNRNNKRVICSQRLIHVFDLVGSHWFAAPLSDKTPEPMYREHGGWQGRSREDALLVQMLADWRVRHAGRSLALSLYDAANAFACSPGRH